ncbi:MAG: hypothetical protein Q8N35_13030 [Methylococcaceae bacterium]|nr:hypothetical protein [Methylococcaceae bacterium]MDZ4217560.1 hypothetical protein [Methylobacter sp.]MDP2395003.1 hypothetical protein [Methylococcaceae bacterium]MDP3020502.1 hypothetical protein [Methylococcaceae bacterium]MDP3389865.1 hypothetical protein [Methylococcaceae bacterium]
MRKLEKPTDDAKTVFLTCISKVKNTDLKSRLTEVADEIESLASNYDQSAANATLNNITQDSVNSIVSNDEMKKVYEYRMARKGQPGRHIYDKLLLMPKHGICPLCGQRRADTLDHHLPQAHYPFLVVTPFNLVAACSACNKSKLNKVSAQAEKQTLHPYYDDVTTERWLYAEVIQGNPAALRFFVQPPENWDDVLKARLHHHFAIFELGVLYTTHAGSELVNQKAKLELLFNRGGLEKVIEDLQDNADSTNCVHKNSWQSAMYHALAESGWYCNRGFLNV